MNVNNNTYAAETDHPLDRVFNPKCITNYHEGTSWPAGAQVDFPHPFPTLSHWIQAFRHRLDHFTSSAELPATADVVVIGSGITGCSAAFHLLAENPELKVVMLEARAFCSGSTGRNGGHLGRPDGFDFQSDVEAIGVDMYREVRGMFAENRRSMFEYIDSRNLAEKISMTWKGGVQIFGSQKERDTAIADLQCMEKMGFPHTTTVLSKEEMAKEMQCENLYGGLYSKDSGSFWPRKFCAAVADETLEKNGEHFALYTNTCVTALKPLSQAGSDQQARWEVETVRGNIAARSVLHATNGWLCALLPELMNTEDEVIPDKEMAVAVRPTPAAGSIGTWKNNIMATNGFHYLAQMPQDPTESRENVVIYGLADEKSTSDDSKLIATAETGLHDMLSFLGHAFPSKFTVQDTKGRIPMDAVDNVWVGLLGRTRDGGIVAGPVSGKKGQFTAAGYNGAGMAKCWFTGKTMASMIAWELQTDARRSEQWEPPEHFPRWFLKHLDEL